MTRPQVHFSMRETNPNETILSRLTQTSLASSPALTPAQARMDGFASQGLETLSDTKTAALVLVGSGVFSHLANAGSFSRVLNFARGASTAESAAPSLSGIFSEAGLFGLRGSGTFGFSRATASILGSSVLLAACSGSEEPEPPTPNATGVDPVGNEFQINTAPNTGTNEGMAIALNDAGDLVVTWADLNLSSPSGTGVFARAYDPSGNPTDIATADHPAMGLDSLPSVATNSHGNFVVSWSNVVGPSSPSSVSARRFDNTGRLIGGTISVLPSAVRNPLPQSQMVLMENGGFALVANDNSDSCGACAHFFNPDNTSASTQPLIPSGATVSALSVGRGESDTWTWAAIVPTSGSNSEIQFQRFSGNSAQGSVAHLSLGNIGTAPQVRVASLPNGHTMFAWQTGSAIMAQVVDEHGGPVSDPTQVTAVSPGGSFSLTSDNHGSFVVAWEEPQGSPDSTDVRIKARILTGEGDPILSTLDVSGSSGQNREVVVSANSSGRVTFGWRRFSTTGGAHQDLIARSYQIQY